MTAVSRPLKPARTSPVLPIRLLELGLFLTLSAAGAVAIWWTAGRRLGASSLSQFLAMESLLGLALLTRTQWFANPWSRAQIIAWICWAMAGLLAVLGLGGRPRPAADTNQITPELDTPRPLPARQGIYRIVRHPYYAAALFLGWGLFATSLSSVNQAALLYAFLLTGASLFLVAAARADETTDYLTYGAAYATYVRTSKMLIPFIL